MSHPEQANGSGTQPSEAGDVAVIALRRLDDQVGYYEKQTDVSRNGYNNTKIAQLIAAAAVPVLTAVEAVRTSQAWIIAALGAFVVVIEGFQQVKGYHTNWLRFAQTAEALKREKYLYLVGAGAYANIESPYRLLEERVEDILSREAGTWASQETHETVPIIKAPPS